MRDIDTLQSEFEDALRTALHRAVKGRSPTLFSLSETRVRSSARSLRSTAEQILELHGSSSGAAQVTPLAARYLAACLRWQHTHGAKPSAVPVVAQELLREVEAYAT